jgi:hypothetical protein
MIPVKYKDRTLHFPDDMTQEDMAAAIQELPEEKTLIGIRQE